MNISNTSSTSASTALPDDKPSRTAFSLGSRGDSIDPRIDAARPDLADIALAGRIFAPYFAKPRVLRTTALVADLRETPSHEACLGSQLLHGEAFAVLEIAEGWAWGFGLHDHYVGYVEAMALGDCLEPGHIVATRLAPLLAEPRNGAKVIGERPMGLQFAVRISGGFAAVAEGYLRAEHLRPLDAPAEDFVTLAERLLDTPYLWGGRSGAGIDCSGLVQLALAFAGISASRDSDLQERDLGRALADDEPLRRGDLVFFTDHVGMMRDDRTLLHATRHWGKTVAEPLADVIARIGARHDPAIRARRRFTREPAIC